MKNTQSKKRTADQSSNLITSICRNGRNIYMF